MVNFATFLMAATHPIVRPGSAPNFPIGEEGELVHSRTQNIPGSVRYSHCRYRLSPDLKWRESGWMIYSSQESATDGKYLELTYCVSTMGYCPHKGHGCACCPEIMQRSSGAADPAIDFATFRFTPDHLEQFVGKVRTSHFSQRVIRFSHTESFTRELPLCEKTLKVLHELGSHSGTGEIENIFVNAQAQILLLYGMECLGGSGQKQGCGKFLENPEMKERIALARNLLLEHLTEPLTIRELSRRVAVNECYLKKGFRELFGTTIFDFFQSQRMEHARFLLYEKGMGVTEVSQVLGYSSISHFSTAFKKHTGLKPCDLLLR